MVYFGVDLDVFCLGDWCVVWVVLGLLVDECVVVFVGCI